MNCIQMSELEEYKLKMLVQLAADLSITSIELQALPKGSTRKAQYHIISHDANGISVIDVGLKKG